MRVISGIYRGRNLLAPNNSDIRPTGDMTKEALFGKIQFQLSGCKFLDLFSGSGAIGIEALSRGAKEVYFNDGSNEAVRLINANLSLIGAKAIVMTSDYETALKMLRDKAFDFIYIDPPYAMDCIDNILKLIDDNNCLSSNGLIIYEHMREKVLKLNNSHYIITDEKHYSSTTLSYIKRKDN